MLAKQLQGISEIAKETTDQAKDCCVLTSFPGESSPGELSGNWMENDKHV